VRFVFRNEGAVVHDAVIGDEAAQEEHEEEMRVAEETTTSDTEGAMGGMDHGATSEEGDGEAAITVEPGEEGELTYTFDAVGERLIGCHEPGHYVAGMRVVVDVAQPDDRQGDGFGREHPDAGRTDRSRRVREIPLGGC